MFIIDKNDDVFAFGPNTLGCLGLRHNKKTEEPEKIRELCGKNIIDIKNGFLKLNSFIESDSMVDLPKARNYTKKTIGIFSNLVDQSHAWDNSITEQKTQISFKILSSIQSTSFTLV